MTDPLFIGLLSFQHFCATIVACRKAGARSFNLTSLYPASSQAHPGVLWQLLGPRLPVHDPGQAQNQEGREGHRCATQQADAAQLVSFCLGWIDGLQYPECW